MAAISINDVTTTLTNGNGVFDVLMRSVDAHLDKQYVSGRIKGSDYATVYMGALQSVLQQAIAFVLSEQKAEKEVDLITAQITGADKDLLVKQEQIDASQANTNMKQTVNTAQVAVLNKQATNFDNDFKYKVMKAAMDIRTTGLTQGLEGITLAAGDAILQDILADAGLVAPNPILVANA